MNSVNHNWVIWWVMVRVFFAMSVVGFVTAVPAIIFTVGVLGGLSGLFGGVGLVGLLGCAMYSMDYTVPWNELTDKTVKMKLTRADRKELKTQRSHIALKAKIQELERINDIKPLEDV